MSMFRTGNPALNNPAFGASQSWGDLESQGRYAGESGASKVIDRTAMTINGTVTKTGLVVAICAASAMGAWTLIGDNNALMMPFLFGGMIGGLILALVTVFKPNFSPVTAPLYAIAEGGFVGAISMLYATRFATQPDEGTEGMVLNTELIFNAALLTFGIAGGVLAAYATRLIRPNKTFYNVVIAGTMGVVLYGLVAMVMTFFGSFSLASVYDPNNGGLLAIGFSGLVVLLASANLVLDYDIVNNGVKNRAPKYMEWYGGFTILVTLVWLYISLLRLLAQLQSRD